MEAGSSAPPLLQAAVPLTQQVAADPLAWRRHPTGVEAASAPGSLLEGGLTRLQLLLALARPLFCRLPGTKRQLDVSPLRTRPWQRASWCAQIAQQVPIDPHRVGRPDHSMPAAIASALDPGRPAAPCPAGADDPPPVHRSPGAEQISFSSDARSPEAARQPADGWQVAAGPLLERGPTASLLRSPLPKPCRSALACRRLRAWRGQLGRCCSTASVRR